MNYCVDTLKKYLHDILTTPSPTGYTYKIMDYLKKELDNLGVKYTSTNKNALIVTFEGENTDYARTFSAHVDTLGAMVKELKGNGRLSFSQVGGLQLNSIEGENCVVETLDGKSYTGTVQLLRPSVHTASDVGDVKRSTESLEIVLDEKVSSTSDLEKLGIDVGDFVFFDTRTIFTESGFVKSRHLDDKASVAILMYAIKYLKENSIKLPYTINFFITNFEEVGHGASAKIPENTKEFIAVDMGAPAPGQNSSEFATCICAKDSSGPYDFELKKKLVTLCKEHNIPYKVDIYPYYGSDASAALRAGHDIRTALIGTGVFASHAYERTHMEGILATLDLVIKLCENK